MIEKKEKENFFFFFFFFLLSRHLFCRVGRVTGNNNKFLLGLAKHAAQIF